MIIIRGATTVAKDKKDEMQAAVKELLDEIFLVNKLKNEEIRGFLFSLTTDIHSYHPAKAARECGYDFAPLFAAIEPEIDGGLQRCIRVMIFTDRMGTNSPVKHVYQKEAKALRKDISEVYNIALDGPAGSGKSTVAKMLARDYNILHLDTGAMYRACGLKALRMGMNPKDRTAMEQLLPDLNIEIEYKDGMQHTLLDGEDVSLAIRENAVSMAASDVSAHPSVRSKMVEKQQQIAKQMSCILDGRDIGTVVLPDADVKLFLVANPENRAKRRYEELLAKGQNVTYEEVLSDMIKRDKNDSERQTAPCVAAPDAILFDNSALTLDETINKALEIIHGKLNETL